MTRNNDRRPGRHQDGDQDNLGAGSGGVVIPMLTAVQLEAWVAAVRHLHDAGLPAAVPTDVAAWLRRRGARPDWETAA